MAENLEILRTELIGMESIIAEFQKWKLIGMGAVFVIGLGLSDSKSGTSNAILALFAIPVVTTYADLLIRDYDVRLSLIARFIRSQQGVLAEYEKSLPKSPTQGFHWMFGNSATVVSSMAANVAVLVIIKGLKQPCPNDDIQSLLFWAAITGIALCLLIQGGFLWMARTIHKHANAADPAQLSRIVR